MVYSVNTSITPRAAAKLLISNELDIGINVSYDTATKILDELLKLSIEECLAIIDFHNYGNIADVKYIPQFGRIDTIIRVPYYFVNISYSNVDYAQLGFFLKPDVNASLGATTKFGENHGKAASILGITSCANKRIAPSALTRAFCSYDNENQNKILLRLFFRIPIIQIILKEASLGKYNGYIPMQSLMASTKQRRSQSLRAIFKSMWSYQNKELNNRINNIVWEE